MKAIVAVAVLCMLSAVRADPPVLWQVQNATGYDYARTEPYLPGNGYAYVGSYYGWVFAQNITSGWVQSQTASMALNLNNTNNVDFLFNCSGGIGVIQDVYVYCLGLDLTPMWKWKANNTISPYYSRSSYGYNFSPLVVNNVLYLGDYYGWVYAVDLATGNALWYKSMSTSGGNCNKQLTYCPIRSVVFATCYYSVHAIDMSTGTELWKTASSSSQLSNQAYDMNTGLLYVSAYGVNIYNASNNGTLVKTVSTQGYTVYIQPFMWGDSWYFFSSTYVTVYNTTTGTSTYSSFSVNSGTSTSIKAYVWGDGNLYALGSSGGYTTGLYQVYPNGTNAAIWYTTSESRAYALTYVGGYVLAAGYYIYAIPVTMGYQATQYTWKTSMSSPYQAVWSPANNGTLITAFQSSTGGTYAFLFAMPFNPNSASGMGVNFPTQYSISQTNIVTNGSVAYTCDSNYYCYGFNQTTNSGWSKQVSSSSLSYYAGVAMTYNNLFSARYDNTMVALSLQSPYALVTPASGGPDMGYTARYPTVVGSDGNIYQATTYTTVMINGQTGALMLKDGSNYPNNQVEFGLNYLYIVSSTKLVAYNTKTATLSSTTAWSATNPKSYSWQSAPLQYGGQVYIADTYGYIYAFGRQTGVQVWVNHNTTNNDNAYYVFGYGSSVYTVTSNSLREYDMSSGVFRWCFVTAGSNSGFSPIITPDGTFVWYTDKIYALDLNTRTLRYTSGAFSPSYPPTFVNGALYWPASSTIYATNAYTGAILFVIRDSSISSRSLAAGYGNQTLWYGSSSAMKAASIAIAANYVTALPPGGSSPSNVDKTEEEKKLWIIAVVVGIVVVIVIIVVIKSKSGGGGDGQRDNNYVSMQQPVNSGV